MVPKRNRAARVSGCRTGRCSGRRPVNSRSRVNEPGPRGSIEIRRTPRGPGSATIDHHVTAFAAERQGVGQTGVWWWRVRTVLGCDLGCACRAGAARSSGRRVLQLKTVEAGASLQGTTGDGQMAATLASPNSKLSNRPLQRTGANGPFSFDVPRAGAARLFKLSANAARPRPCYYRRSRNGPCR